MIHTGDCIEVMRTLPADSVDAVVTDPPYGLEFMGKEWDAFKPAAAHTEARTRRAAEMSDPVKAKFLRHNVNQYSAGSPFQAWCQQWGTEALRVTKPGGYLLAFGGTRTHHRLVCGLEDAGWIIRDELDWVYASGFPKGKANLKPAHEPIVLARKPGPLRPLGIDAGRIPGVPPSVPQPAFDSPTGHIYGMKAGEGRNGEMSEATGRWPSNVLLDPDSAALFDEPNPEVVGSGATASTGGFPTDERGTGGIWHEGNGVPAGPQYGDTGGYSRFFIVPKSSRADREPVVRGTLAEGHAGVGIRAAEPGEYDDFVYPAPEGIGGWLKEQRIAAGYTRQTLAPLLPDHKNLASAAANVSNWEHEFNRPTASQWRTLREVIGFDDRYDGVMTTTTKVARTLMDGALPARRENTHPTCKPVDLMRHLIRLVTPSGGTVLDPFLGSGSTAIAAELEGFPWIGIEKEPEYVAIAEARLNGTQRGLGLDVGAPVRKRTGKYDDNSTAKRWEYPGAGSWHRDTNAKRRPPEEPAA